MNIPILLFVYNRIDTTRKVLESIRYNHVHKLIIFQDGPKKDDDPNWEIVNELINQIDWCDKEIIVSKQNKGLVASILQGLNYSFQRYDAAIVIEDDCCLHKDFYRFVKAGLEKYSNDKSIYSITGYRWPIKIPDRYNNSIYVSYRISSWGWATWKDRWDDFSKDYGILARIKENPSKNCYLEWYGRDLERMLAGNLGRSENSWAVFWALSVIDKEGKTISPVKNLISHIGYGNNSGVHNTIRTVFDMDLYGGDYEFEFPDKITSAYELEEEFYDMIKKHFPLATEQNQYYRDALNKWIQLKGKQISLADILLKRGIHSSVIFGITSETELIINELGNRVPVKYILTSKGTEKMVNGITVTNTILFAKEDMVLIVIPGFIIDNVKVNWDLSDFGMVIGFKELLELGE